jgi:copper chaperone CopZ
MKKTYTIKDMDCPNCACALECDLEDIGVKASCNYAKELLTVEFDETKISEKKIRKIVKSSGSRLVTS